MSSDGMWMRANGEWFGECEFGKIESGDEMNFHGKKFVAKEVNH